MRSVADASAERNIRINLLCPGVVETGFLATEGRRQLEAKGFVVLDPHDVAVAAAALLGDDRSGQVFLQMAPGAPVLHTFPVFDRPGR